MRIYPINTSVSIEEIIKAKEEFLRSGVLNTKVVRVIIAESWIRCSNLGIDPNKIDTSKVLAGDEYSQKLAENELLLKIAKPFMEKLYLALRGSNYVVILYSKDGYHIQFVGSDADFSILDDFNLLKGICCREESVGTCGFALASQLKAPVQILGAEHYSNLVPNFCGSYAPILEGNSEAIGVLGITSLTNTTPHLHTLGMVIASAAAIENHLKQHNTLEELHFYSKRLQTTVDSISDGLISIDSSGRIMEINTAAEKITGVKAEEVTSREIDRAIQAKPSFSRIMAKSFRSGADSKEDFVQTITAGGKLIRCVTSATPIKNPKGGFLGAVFLLKNIKRMEKIVRRLSSFQALHDFDDIVGESRKIQDAKELAMAAARASSNILIEGESGTGKELFAHAIHLNSDRHAEPFVSINCSAIPHDLFESILFGYEKGAFTGARKEGSPGKFEIADGGTLVLDEVSDLPLALQVKLLRVIAEGKVERLGANYLIPVNVRIISITNKNLSEEVKEGRFRLDLYYRLNIFKMEIPPLRERKDDISPLVDHFIKTLAPTMGKKITKVTPDFIESLKRHDWPGNVRELRNVVERALIMAKGSKIDYSCLPEYIRSLKEPLLRRKRTSDLRLKDIEKDVIQRALVRAGGNKSLAARILGIGRETLYRKIRAMSIEVPQRSIVPQNKTDNQGIEKSPYL